MRIPSIKMLALVSLSMLVTAASTASAAPIGFSVQSAGNNRLYAIDLATGQRVNIGAVGFGDVEGLTFQPGTGDLFGYDDTTEQLIRIDVLTGAGTALGPSGVTTLDVGLTFDASGNLWLADEDHQNFYSVNPLTGAATLVGGTGREITALASIGAVIYGLDDDNNALVTINPLTGASTLVGALGVDVADTGLDAAGGLLWAITDDGLILTIDPTTGAASLEAFTAFGYEGLAISGDAVLPVPEPASVLLLGVGLVAAWRRMQGTRVM
jgi:hypothetical protein